MRKPKQILPFGRRSALSLGQLAEHNLSAHNRLIKYLRENARVERGQLPVVGKFDRGPGNRPDQMRSAAGVGVDAPNPAVAPELGIEARNRLGVRPL